MAGDAGTRIEAARSWVHEGAWSTALAWARADALALAYVREAAAREGIAAPRPPETFASWGWCDGRADGPPRIGGDGWGCSRVDEGWGEGFEPSCGDGVSYGDGNGDGEGGGQAFGPMRWAWDTRGDGGGNGDDWDEGEAFEYGEAYDEEAYFDTAPWDAVMRARF